MGDPLEQQQKKLGKNEKFGQSHSAEKKEGKGDPSALEWLFISC